MLLAGGLPCAGAEASEEKVDVDLFMARNVVGAFGIRGSDGQLLVARKAPEMQGRGYPDTVGEEPDYRGVVGYASLQISWDVSQFNTFTQIPWQLPVYRRSSDSWVIVGTIQHKTPVLVVDQILQEQKGHKYAGYLKVVRLDTQKTIWIDVTQFVTVPYWTLDLKDAVQYGFCIAVYRSRSNAEPMDKKKHRGMLPDGLRILMCAKQTARYYSPDRENNPLLGIVFRSTSAGASYSRTFLFFNPEDLALVY